MENNELIAEKEEQIKKLKDEIKELRTPSSLKSLLTNKMLGIDYHSGKLGAFRHVRDDGWDCIRRTCLVIHKHNHKLENITMNSLERSEIEFSARMADEIVDIWNKYMCELYGKEQR